MSTQEDIDIEMEAITEEQADIGNKIERLLVNFGKDPEQRKTTKYIEKRLELADAYWFTFEANHKKLAVFREAHQESLYFKNSYFERIQQVYNQLRTRLLEFPVNPQEPTTNTATMTTDSATTSAGIPKTIDSSTTKDNKKFIEAKFTRGNEEEAERLIRKQKALMRTISRQIQGIEARAGEDHTAPYYELKVQMLLKYQDEMMNNDQAIWEISSEEDPSGYDVDLVHELDSWIQDTIVSLQQKLLSLRPSSTANNSASPHIQGNQVKLPKVVLPTFDGNYLRWTQFHDLYIHLIHNQPISNAQKLFYLTSNLSGEARTLIQHLPVSDDNYEDAWSILKNRYNSKRLLVTALLNKLLSQPISQSESAAAIKALHDTTNECLLGLKNLGISTETWDPIIVHLITKKLDKNTHTLYEQSLEAPRELNSIKNLLEFLETRFQSLETLGNRVRGSLRDKAYQRTNIHSKPSSFIAISRENQCIACKRNHQLYACNSFLALTPTSRLQLLKKHRLCINCMRDGHSAANCKFRSCTKCLERHNTLVHLEKVPNERVGPHQTTGGTTSHSSNPNRSGHIKVYPESEASLQVNQRSVNQSTTLTAQTTQSQKGYVLLSTVIVKLKNNEGKEVDCRAILDSGSQVNLITDKLAKKLSLKEVRDPQGIQGIGTGVSSTQYRVNVALHSKINGFSTRIEAFILPTITTYQPTQQIDIKSWTIPENIKLADPDFHRPGRIDLLIGAELYFNLLSIGQVNLGANLPVLQNTVFGWVVSGKVQNTPNTKIICGVCTQEGNLDEQIERFWKLEEVNTIMKNMTSSEIKCESHFNQHTQRSPDGRFVVRLPFSQDPKLLGESKDIALTRFYSLERKMNGNPEMKKQYTDFTHEYIRFGHMEEMKSQDIPAPHYFLPHHSVLKLGKPLQSFA